MMTPANLQRFRRQNVRCRPGWSVIFCAALLLAAAVHGGAAETNQPAEVKISGFGFFGNRDLVRLLRHFQPDNRLPPVITPSFVEDAALVLFSQAHNEGYLNAQLQASFTLNNGGELERLWTNALQVRLTPAFAATAAHFRIKSGERFYYRSIELDGLHAISEAEARSYFISGETLIRLRSDRIYSPGRLQDSMAALRQALMHEGYRSVEIITNQVLLDETSGAVTVKLEVHEGLPTQVRSVSVTVTGPGGNSTNNQPILHPDKPYSLLWRQDLSRRLQEQQFARGFPDTTVELKEVRLETNATAILLDLAARVDTGPRVRVGKILFRGNRHTRSSVIRSRMTLRPGAWLDPLAAEQSRQRLARLGVFDSVQLSYEGTNATARDVVYQFKEAKPISLSLLAGYGSYEMLRGGLEWEDRDVLGLAHDLRIRAVQSFKSTSGEAQYTVPEVFGEDLDAFVKGAGLRRQEISFLRKEYGGSLGIQKYLAPIKTDFSLQYNYEFLKTSDLDTSTNAGSLGATNARSAAIVFDFNRDQRVTPLLPRHGLKLFSRIELAADALGGNVTYQRLLLGSSYHMDLIDGLLLHLGVTHGMTFTVGGNPDQLPFNKRFFPGGENSIRGYQEGQASPLDSDGNQLGAETYTLGNIELEQLLTKSWSVVGFFDALGMARDRSNYPWNEGLFSVGGGLCWRTPIGPVRLEYGYNLNPRQHDPKGTLHFSVGFPF